MRAVLRALGNSPQYVVEAVLLTIFGLHRIFVAWRSNGDVYDAKVIFASDISDLGGHRLAVRWLSRLIASDPQRPRAYFERGLARLELNDAEGAKDDLSMCLRIAPEFPGAQQWYSNASEWPPRVA